MTPEAKHSVSFVPPNRTRSSSNTESRLSMSDCVQFHESSPSEFKRTHSASVSSVTSQMSEDLDPIFRKQRYSGGIDLENQLIMTAGGSNASICCFILKILFLSTVVLGCGVLVFYAL